MRYFTSDPHLGHQRIIDLAQRPFDNVDQMNRAIVDWYADSVVPGDELWILGDIAMGDWQYNLGLLDEIDCSLVFVLGNHDKGHPSAKGEAVLDAYYSIPNVRDVYLEGTTIEIDGVTFNVNHFPYYGDAWQRDKLLKYLPKDDGNWLLHGHVHSQWFVKDRMINVGVDAAPWLLSEEDILELTQGGNREAEPWVR